ncbi:MAG: hypothetical protein DRJ35_04635 [Thermoprotei archaeon]|nr:MAG: hypothetical protein DRJ35_04635 [Thermoprotei archaeon]
MEDWKRDQLKNMGIKEIYEPTLEEWILLTLYLDGKKPIYGLEVLQFIFFMYPYVNARFTPLFFAPYSPDIEKVLVELEQKGLVDRRTEFINGRISPAIYLTTKGEYRSKNLFKKLHSGWIVSKGFVIRIGTEILQELEALKKTYNGKSLVELLQLLASKIEAERENVFLNLPGDSENIIDTAIKYAREFLKDIRRLKRKGE